MTLEEPTEKLFSYGTLQREEVQLSTFGRTLEGGPDSLTGYEVTLIPIKDQSVIDATGDTHYRNIRFTGLASDVVDGTAFKVPIKELEQADGYEEDANYRRVVVELSSGVKAWVYLSDEL